MLVEELLRECERTFELDFDLALLIDGLREAGSIIMKSIGNGAEPGVAIGGLGERRSMVGFAGRYPPRCIGRVLTGREADLWWPRNDCAATVSTIWSCARTRGRRVGPISRIFGGDFGGVVAPVPAVITDSGDQSLG